MECIKPFALEKNIIKDFNEKFKLIAGNEYYEGDELSMITLFQKNVMDHRNNDDILNVKEERKVEEIFKKRTGKIIIENDDKKKSHVKNVDVKLLTESVISDITKNNDDDKCIGNKTKYKCNKCGKYFIDNYNLNLHAKKKISCGEKKIFYEVNYGIKKSQEKNIIINDLLADEGCGNKCYYCKNTVPWFESNRPIKIYIKN